MVAIIAVDQADTVGLNDRLTPYPGSGHSPCTTYFSIDSQISQPEMTSFGGHPRVMLTEIYIEALLVDEQLADQVWKAWIVGDLDDSEASVAWLCIVVRSLMRFE